MRQMGPAIPEKPSFSMVNFMSELGSHILDTYLVVTIALDIII